MQPSLTRRMLAEVIGTFGFFFFGFIGIAVASTHPSSIGTAGVAAGFGVGLMMMLFAFAHISGGHFNPAVTFGLAAGGRFPWSELPGYWLAQLTGGVIAATVVRLLFTSSVADALANAPGKDVSAGTALILEVIATLLFLLVISAVATDERAPWHGVLAPIAIGGFIFLGATVIGPLSGGSFNPARSISPAIVATSFTNLWIYVAGPLLGGALGGVLFSFVRRRGTADEVREEALVEGS
jgi:MIP family channel proteins